jgi:glycosyl transferase family 1
MRRLRILTWHVHGTYLDSLVATGHRLYVPVGPDGSGGVPATAGWADAVTEVPREAVRDLEVDVVLYQSARHWQEDRLTLLSDAQREGPRVYVEHDPPREHPTDTRHPVDDPETLLVQVTAFNALMWDTGRTPVRVIEHGLRVTGGASWSGDVRRGLVVVNELHKRGRRLGADLVEHARRTLPLDVAGIDSDRWDGLGDLSRPELHQRMADHRFFFHPARYTSFGMAVCEAMLIGQPIVALATTEMPTVLEDGRNGITSTDPAALERGMAALLEDHGLAMRLGAAGRETARQRFAIERFAREWTRAFEDALDLAPVHAAAAR